MKRCETLSRNLFKKTRKKGYLLSLEVFVGLAFAVMMITFMFFYVNSRLNSDGYFQDFYSQDLALLATAVTAAPGNMVVTYDNFKKNKISYEFEKGIVRAIIGDRALDEVEYFGYFDSLTVAKTTLEEPEFVSFARSNNQFQINEAAGLLATCSLDKRTRPVQPTVSGFEVEELSRGMRETMDPAFGVSPSLKSENATIFFDVQKSDKVIIEHSSDEETKYLACVLQGQLDLFGIESESKVSSQSEGHIKIQSNVNSRLLGQLLGRVVVIYARQ